MNTMNSFGNYPISHPKEIFKPAWQDQMPSILDSSTGLILPIGLRRSYGDSCLNDAGDLIDLTGMNKIIYFDDIHGVMRTEAGMNLKEILSIIVPRGWFLPVSPGTRYVTIGGAIANDIHGKNHHKAGSFGNHVIRFALQRSDADELIVCSETENADLFYATIGGLGLTGVILWAEFTLSKIDSPMMNTKTERFTGYSEYGELSKREDSTFTVSWFDSVSGGSKFMRGLFNSGEFIHHDHIEEMKGGIPIPLNAPENLLNQWTMKIFNSLYYRKNIRKVNEKIQHYVPFFYPLDSLRDWNKLYGKKGFVQYQCVIPHESAEESIQHIVRHMQAKKMGSFLVVLKSFGTIKSRGLLSFPMPGMTLAMDFPMRGSETLNLLSYFDDIVHEAGGRVYPAKDARMSGEHFRSWYPGFEQMIKLKDPKISSDFWKRVMK
jgi:FAD/FMN-containing dehydrogenase